MAPFSSSRTAWVQVACCISRGSQGGIQRGEGNGGGKREQFRTSALMSRIIEEELPTEPGRVHRGVDRETDGSWVVENLIVISSLKKSIIKMIIVDPHPVNFSVLHIMAFFQSL